MRLLLVENKYDTHLWDELAPLLIEDGFEIHWLVQNPWFRPRHGIVHMLSFPRRQDLMESDGAFVSIRDRDRGINYFGGDDRHYRYYNERIAALLDEIAPDLVIGEPTLFHEMLTISLCRERTLPYYMPTSVRYPSDRFGFFEYDTQVLTSGSGDVVAEAELDRLLDVYGARKQVPLFYEHLSPSRRSRLRSRVRSAGKAGAAIISRLAGERFNTPSLPRKLRLEIAKSRHLAAWEAVAAAKPVSDGRTRILFPLQVLPESNLEGYGYPWRDQLGTLAKLVEASPDDAVVLVKVNPVPRYEVTEAMVEFVRSHPRVVPLPTATTMDSLFWDVDLIATVTGTVAIEAFLCGRPFVTLAYSLATPFAGEHTLIQPDDLPTVLDRVRDGGWPVGDRAQRRGFLEYQIANSHAGIVADTFNFPGGKESANLANIRRAFRCLPSASPYAG